jgi:hypothetical protein
MKQSEHQMILRKDRYPFGMGTAAHRRLVDISFILGLDVRVRWWATLGAEHGKALSLCTPPSEKACRDAYMRAWLTERLRAREA